MELVKKYAKDCPFIYPHSETFYYGCQEGVEFMMEMIQLLTATEKSNSAQKKKKDDVVSEETKEFINKATALAQEWSPSSRRLTIRESTTKLFAHGISKVQKGYVIKRKM